MGEANGPKGGQKGSAGIAPGSSRGGQGEGKNLDFSKAPKGGAKSRIKID